MGTNPEPALWLAVESNFSPSSCSPFLAFLILILVAWPHLGLYCRCSTGPGRYRPGPGPCTPVASIWQGSAGAARCRTTVWSARSLWTASASSLSFPLNFGPDYSRSPAAVSSSHRDATRHIVLIGASFWAVAIIIIINILGGPRYVPEARWPNANLSTVLDVGTWASMKKGSGWGWLYDPEMNATGIDFTGARATMNLGSGVFTWVRAVRNFSGPAFNFTTGLDGLKKPSNFAGNK